MKSLLILAALLAPTAQAETITLGSVPARGNVAEFVDVPNNQGLEIEIFPSSVTIDGVTYLNKELISISLTITTTYSYVGSGRGQHRVAHYLLVSGTIVR